MFKNNAPNYASATDTSKKGMMVKSVRNAPLRRIGLFLWGVELRNNIPPPRLHALLAERYDSS